MKKPKKHFFRGKNRPSVLIKLKIICVPVVRYEAGHSKEMIQSYAAKEALGFRITWTAFWIPTDSVGTKGESLKIS